MMKNKTAMTTCPNKNLQNKAPTQIQLGNLTIKQVMIADLGDGAFTDHSIKIKPNKKGPGVVLKCTNLKRLVAGLATAGIDPRLVKITKGSKHFIAFVEQGSKVTTLAKA